MAAAVPISQYVARPLELVQSYLKNEHLGPDAIAAKFRDVFNSEEALSIIPLLNDTPASSLQDRTLVRFRCMIQDNSFNVQEYFHEITLRNSETGEEMVVPTLYSDSLPDYPGFVPVDIDMMQFSVDKVGEKHPVFCVSVPAETEWARDGFRQLGVQDNDGKLSQTFDHLNLGDPIIASQDKLRLKMPLPQEKHATAAMVKTYGVDPQFHLNDVVEVVGVLEKSHPDSQGQDTGIDSTSGLEFSLPPDGAEQMLYSTIPEIHAMFYRKLSRTDMNPAVRNVNVARQAVTDLDMQKLRRTLIDYIASYLFGDRLAAEFLLLHLFSKIHHRAADDTPIGFFPLNICGCPSDAIRHNLTSNIIQLLRSLLPRCHNVSLTLKRLNEDTWLVPAQGRDAPDNVDVGVAAGELQLADGTWVVVDEMGLEDGVLKERGVQNMSHLGEIIRTSKLPYLIRYGEMSRNVDYGILVLSQGRCMFSVECVIPLAPMSDTLAPLPLSEDLLIAARLAIGLMPIEDYAVPDEFVDMIGKQYAEQRSTDYAEGRPVTTNADLSRRLELARLVTRSFGRKVLDIECWEYAGNLEAERLERLKMMPTREGGTNPVRTAIKETAGR